MIIGYQDPPTNSNVISEFLAPAYMQFSLGMDYKPNDNFSLYISPLTSKSTIVMDDSLSKVGAYGVEAGEKYRGEYGASLKSVYKKENLLQNVDFFTRLDLFSNLADEPQQVDGGGEGGLNFKINNFLTGVASRHLVYDHDVKTSEKVLVDGESTMLAGGPKLQSKQLLGFGLNFKF